MCINARDPPLGDARSLAPAQDRAKRNIHFKAREYLPGASLPTPAKRKKLQCDLQREGYGRIESSARNSGMKHE